MQVGVMAQQSIVTRVSQKPTSNKKNKGRKIRHHLQNVACDIWQDDDVWTTDATNALFSFTPSYVVTISFCNECLLPLAEAVLPFSIPAPFNAHPHAHKSRERCTWNEGAGRGPPHMTGGWRDIKGVCGCTCTVHHVACACRDVQRMYTRRGPLCPSFRASHLQSATPALFQVHLSLRL
jgi:hypothetical protein